MALRWSTREEVFCGCFEPILFKFSHALYERAKKVINAMKFECHLKILNGISSVHQIYIYIPFFTLIVPEQIIYHGHLPFWLWSNFFLIHDRQQFHNLIHNTSNTKYGFWQILLGLDRICLIIIYLICHFFLRKKYSRWQNQPRLCILQRILH